MGKPAPRPPHLLNVSGAIAAALGAAALFVFWPAGGHQFIRLDDTPYVTDNPMVQRGLTIAGIRWSLTAFHSFNWHPLTWISHMLDVTLFGMWAGGHHLVSVFIHALSTLLLFSLLRRLTASRWRSAVVAALFAVHPLHVESVVWVAERKDVLAGLFWMLTLLAYARHVERPGPRRLSIVTAVFLLGLLCKPMLVSLPFVLLLLDYWPLGRLSLSRVQEPRAASRRSLLWLVREKAPLFLLSAGSSLVTYLAQQSGEAVRSWAEYPLGVRAANAAVSTIRYLWLALEPAGLIPYYPHPGAEIPAWRTGGALLLLAAATALGYLGARRRPYLLVGWLWFAGTLVPVLGLVQVGGQALADRYTYLPLIGIFLVAVWGCSDHPLRARHPRAAALLTLTVLAAFAALGRIQVGHWRDETTLQRHVLSVDPDNYLGLTNLGVSQLRRGNRPAAVALLNQAYRSNPRLLAAVNLRTGYSLLQQGKRDEAVTHFCKAAQIDPFSADARDALRQTLAGEVQGIRAQFRQQISAGGAAAAAAHHRQGQLFGRQCLFEEALTSFQEAIRLDPRLAEAQSDLGTAYVLLGRFEEAARAYERALELKPDLREAREGLRVVRSRPRP